MPDATDPVVAFEAARRNAEARMNGKDQDEATAEHHADKACEHYEKLMETEPTTLDGLRIQAEHLQAVLKYAEPSEREVAVAQRLARFVGERASAE